MPVTFVFAARMRKVLIGLSSALISSLVFGVGFLVTGGAIGLTLFETVYSCLVLPLVTAFLAAVFILGYSYSTLSSEVVGSVPLVERRSVFSGSMGIAQIHRLPFAVKCPAPAAAGSTVRITGVHRGPMYFFLESMN